MIAMTNKQTIDGVSHHCAEIEAAVRGAFEDGKKDYNGCMRERLRELRALLDKPESLDLEEPHVVGYMPDHPDGDPLITLEDHQNYVAALLARQASALKADPVGCRYRKTDRPDRCWTYCEGVKVTPWEGWEVQPLFTELPAAQPQGEPVAVVDEDDDGIFVELIYGENGNPLRRGDKLYTDQPQGEIEDERGEALSIYDDAMEACAEVERNSVPGDAIREMNDELVDMRDQLAERDALLKRCESFIKFVHKCVRRNGEYAPLHRQEMDELNRDLSDYGESSFSVCEQCRGEGRVGGPAPDEGGGKNCPACGGTGVIEPALSTSAEPKPRGEAVAWAREEGLAGISAAAKKLWPSSIQVFSHRSDLDGVSIPLFRQQPAPVAVVMPERKQSFDDYTFKGCRDAGYNEALAEVAKLNGLKP